MNVASLTALLRSLRSTTGETDPDSSAGDLEALAEALDRFAEQPVSGLTALISRTRSLPAPKPKRKPAARKPADSIQVSRVVEAIEYLQRQVAGMTIGQDELSKAVEKAFTDAKAEDAREAARQLDMPILKGGRPQIIRHVQDKLAEELRQRRMSVSDSARPLVSEVAIAASPPEAERSISAS